MPAAALSHSVAMSATKENEMVESVELEGKMPSDTDSLPLTSAYATWTRAQCVKKFWRLYLTGMMTSIAGM
jgi:hypothetical protein